MQMPKTEMQKTESEEKEDPIKFNNKRCFIIEN